MPTLTKKGVFNIYVDGGMIGHRNPSTEGVIYSVGREKLDGSVILWASRKENRKHFTNNCAEYLSLQYALWYLTRHPTKAQAVRIHCDSQLIVNQVNGNWRCLDLHLITHRDVALAYWRQARKQGWTLELVWVRRQENVRRLGH